MARPNGLSDVREHYRQRLTSSPGSSVSAQDLYDDYCFWCEAQGKQALAMPVCCRELKTLGLRKGTLRPHEHARPRVYYLDVEIGDARAAWHDPVLPIVGPR